VPVTSGFRRVETSYYIANATAGVGSLRVHLEPAAAAAPGTGQWRIVLGDPNWRDSGAEIASLPAGPYLVEFRELAGYATPAVRRVTVIPGPATVVSATYNVALAAVGTAPVELSFSQITQDLAIGLPYAYAGQIQSEIGFGSGFVVKRHVVLTAAHVLFNDATYEYVAGARWFFQRHRGDYEPVPQSARGWYVFSGYAEQRETENTPGVSGPASQDLDVGVVYFLEPAGRDGSSGFLVSEPGTEWLQATAAKMLIGYPMEGVAETNRGRMYATSASNVQFTPLTNRVFWTQEIRGYAGMSGGPVCVQTNGVYFPAAIYLGGTTRAVVRAIDGKVAEFINQAETMADTGDKNNVSGGVGFAPTGPGASPFAPGYLRVEITPPEAVAALAGWRILGSGNTNWVSDNAARLPLLAATYTVEFHPATGYETPTNRPAPVVVEQDTVLSVTYVPASLRLLNPTVVGTEFRVSILGSAGERCVVYAGTNLANPAQWTAVATNASLPSGGWSFVDPSVPANVRRFYRAGR
jgi:hypothetical protein